MKNVNSDSVDVNESACGCLESIAEQGFGLPFQRPISLSFAPSEGTSLAMGPWCVYLEKKTKSGRRSSTGGKFVLLNNCPICGRAIKDEDVESPDRDS